MYLSLLQKRMKKMKLNVSDTNSAPRKPYSSPQLKLYGDIHKVTLALNTGAINDGTFPCSASGGGGGGGNGGNGGNGGGN